VAFLSLNQLRELGLKAYGENVQISEHANFYGARYISLGNNVRIDDFCILSAGPKGFEIHDYVHIACYAFIIGRGKVTMRDFSGLSSRVGVYSSSDNYNGEYLTNPTIPEYLLNTKHADVIIGKHCVIGSSSIILPGVTIHDGSAIGAMTLVNKDIPPNTIGVGSPVRILKSRGTRIFSEEKKLK
jgi:galactoside O-acetyltransferase